MVSRLTSSCFSVHYASYEGKWNICLDLQFNSQMEIAETIQVIINELCYDVPKLRQLRCHCSLFNSF